MKLLQSRIAHRVLVIAALATAARLCGQEFTVFDGLSAHQGVDFDSYSWMIDYRQGIAGDIDASLTWINEGHFEADSAPHHRDGLALEAWADLPTWWRNVGFSWGAGGDYFFRLRRSGREIARHTP
ncbi:MAG: hypothetical protein ACREFX_14710, partial [Opitutaceae bacterium]